MTSDAASVPLLSIIVVNWNGARFLSRLFDSLRAQTLCDIQTILVDNGSTDESVLMTLEGYPEVDIIELGENLGYAEANNRGVAYARARYLFFLNNDTHLHPTALSSLIATAEADSFNPILAPQIRTYNGAEPLTMGISLDVLGFPCGQDKVFYADGAAFFIRRDVFLLLGGFDPSHFMFFEETDLCWRAWLQGYHIKVVPSAIVYHKAGGTAGSSVVVGGHYTTNRSKRHLSHRNQAMMLLKNYSALALVVILPLFITVTIAEILLLLISGQWVTVHEAYVPAWRDLLHQRVHIRTMRRKIQAVRTVSDYMILRRLKWRLAMFDHLRNTGIPTIK